MIGAWPSFLFWSPVIGISSVTNNTNKHLFFIHCSDLNVHDEIIKATASPKVCYKTSRFLPYCPLRKKKPLSSEQFEMKEKYVTGFEGNIFCSVFFSFFDAKFVSISRKANNGDKSDKKRKFSKNCSFFIIMIVSIFFCLATPFLLFTFLGQMQPHQTILEKSARKPTTEEFHLLVDEGNNI